MFSRLKSSNKKLWMDEQGFTIAELLVSLALLSLITLLGIEGLRTVGFMNRVSKISDGYEHSKIIEKHLVQVISSARPVFTEVQSKKNILAFKGEKNRIELVTDASTSIEIGGLYLVEFLSDGHQLLVTRRVFRPRQSLKKIKAKQRVLLKNMDTISFQYFGKLKAEAVTARWYDEWKNSQRLPQIVKVKFSKQPNSKSNDTNLTIFLAASKR